ncbi:MAG TPA: hypothetical protein VGF61_02750 [Candidatus Acidoferrum sp.]
MENFAFEVPKLHQGLKELKSFFFSGLTGTPVIRSGQGWDEGTKGDVLLEILHVYPEYVKKALGLALMRGKF